MPSTKPDELTGNKLLSVDYEDNQEYPDIIDLSSRIRFAPHQGRIWLDDKRMFLMHNRAFGELRREIIDAFGKEAARNVLTRMGYTSGTLDAQLASKVRKDKDTFDAFSAGPQLHSLLGIVKVECTKFEINYETGHFFTEYLWHDSIEDDANIRHFGVGADAACWMQIGYACGYSSAFMGRPILYREVECRSMGLPNCKIIGKPVEEWDNPDEDLAYLHGDYEGTKSSVKTKVLSECLSPTQLQPDVTEDVDNNDEIITPQIVGASPGFRVACHMVEKVAETDATVLFLGESGVGKEVFANHLHRLSLRKNLPFVAVNCASIPDELVESELFGVEKGAFTGAITSRPGRFERADGGTLFLDEIGTLSMSAQSKLLRALQEGEIERVGDTRIRNVDVRVISATNVDLKDAIQKGEFRSDLFFRLNVFPIFIPPLKERRADIPLLLNHFLKKFTRRHRKNVNGFSERALHTLFTYDWPGNIREMENMIERGVILSDPDGALDLGHLFTSGEEIPSSLFSLNAAGELGVRQGESSKDEEYNTDLAIRALLEKNVGFEQIEGLLIQTALKDADGNLSAAARKLNLTRPQLAYRLEKKQKH